MWNKGFEWIEQRKCINSAMLKWIAVSTMLCDHIAFVLVAAYYYAIFPTGNVALLQRTLMLFHGMRFVGETSFVLFAFLLVEGFKYTKKKRVHIVLLALFSFLSEVPFDLAINGKRVAWEGQNVIPTLLIGFLVIYGMDYFWQKRKRTAPGVNEIMADVLLIAGGCLLAQFLRTDYDWRGVVLIVIFYIFRYDKALAMLIGYISFLWKPLCFPAFFLIAFYNGQKGRQWKYFFYLFYPIHLLVLYAIKQYLFG